MISVNLKAVVVFYTEFHIQILLSQIYVLFFINWVLYPLISTNIIFERNLKTLYGNATITVFAGDDYRQLESDVSHVMQLSSSGRLLLIAEVSEEQ